MAKVGSCIDELEVNLLQRSSRGLLQQALTEGDWTLLGTGHSSLDHQEILPYNTVMRESTKRGDWLLGWVKRGGRIVLLATLLTHAVHLLVDFRTVMETHLTCTCNSPLHA